MPSWVLVEAARPCAAGAPQHCLAPAGTNMDTVDEREVLALLRSVLDLPESGRDVYLDSACAGRSAMRKRVEELLGAARDDGAFPVFRVEAGRPLESLHFLPTEESHGDGAAVVGPYRLLDVLGEGGMGVVYRAEQAQPQREVALKMLRSQHLESDAFRRRFEREVEILGKLEHPGIARIYDAGTATVDGALVPFIAMELVRGISVLQYSEEKCPEVHEKLALIAQVADAVHAAHQKTIVHRDLKPGNILVTASGEAKVLDFGIATSTAVDVDGVHRTRAGDLIGTLAYMSPEQARCDSEQTDARSDIYSLGLVGYEMLAGEPAFCGSHGPVDVVIRRIERGEPKSLGRVSRGLRGDVEAMISKACRQDPAERYQSAAALAEDIRRHIECRPISARPVSAMYEFRKLAQRNRVAVTSLAIGVVALVAGVIVATLAFLVVDKQKATLQATTEFQADRLRSIDVAAMAVGIRRGLVEKIRGYLVQSLEPDVEGVMTELDRVLAGVDFTGLALDGLYVHVFAPALTRIEEGFAERPLIQANLLHSMGATLRELGRPRDAAAPLRRAFELRRRIQGGEDASTLQSMRDLAETLHALGQNKQAREYQEHAIEVLRRKRGRGDLKALSWLMDLAATVAAQGEFDEAQRLQQDACDDLRLALGDEDLTVLTAMSHLSMSLRVAGDCPAAQELQEHVLKIRRAKLGPDDPATIQAMHNLALTLVKEPDGREDAQALQERVFEVRLRSRGEAHPLTISAMNNLASTYRRRQQFSDAKRLNERAIKIRRDTLGARHSSTLVSIHNLGLTLYEMKDYAGARVNQDYVLDVLRQDAWKHPMVFKAMDNLILTLVKLNELEDARKLCEEVLDARLQNSQELDGVAKSRGWLKQIEDKIASEPR